MIEVKTILNANLVRKFNADQSRKRIWFPAVMMLVFVVTGIVGLALEWDTFLSIFLIVVGLLLPVVFMLTVRILMNRALKNAPLLKSETTQIWRFMDDKILFNESGKYVEAHDTILSYDAIYKVRESETAFYVYTSKMQAYILDGKGIVMGTRRGLHDFLRDKVGSRYKFPKRLYVRK